MVPLGKALPYFSFIDCMMMMNEFVLVASRMNGTSARLWAESVLAQCSVLLVEMIFLLCWWK